MQTAFLSGSSFSLEVNCHRESVWSNNCAHLLTCQGDAVGHCGSWQGSPNPPGVLGAFPGSVKTVRDQRAVPSQVSPTAEHRLLFLAELCRIALLSHWPEGTRSQSWAWVCTSKADGITPEGCVFTKYFQHSENNENHTV